MADLVSPSDLTSRLVILPLRTMLVDNTSVSGKKDKAYQKLKKSRISLSSV